MSATSEEGARRAYRSPQREAAARDTRRRIREAARRLFLADGYAATSVRAVARAAGVAEKTVYLQYDAKLALLKDVVETAIVGDDDAVAAADREWFRAVVAEPDPTRKLALLADATAALHERTGSVFAIARGAASVDPDAAALWSFGKQGHRADMSLLAESCARDGLLPEGRDVDWALSVLYVTLGPETWHLLRHELGQDADGYRDWLGATLTETFTTTGPRGQAPG